MSQTGGDVLLEEGGDVGVPPALRLRGGEERVPEGVDGRRGLVCEGLRELNGRCDVLELQQEVSSIEIK